MSDLIQLGRQAKAAATRLAVLLSGEKDAALAAMANGLEADMGAILDANEQDMAAARESGMSAAMQDRLRLDEARIRNIAAAVRQTIALPDPVGRVLGGGYRPNGLHMEKITVPMGVVGIIFESRPNVTADCAALCLKSGNACILRGGKEAIRSNRAIVASLQAALESAGLPRDAVQLVGDTSRETAAQMMRLGDYLDLLIPRGGAGLIQSVVQNATVPVIETGVGICHVYVDQSADLEMAAAIVDNAKTSRPSVCNAIEAVLVHRTVAGKFLPMMAQALAHAGVELRCCPETLRILGDRAKPAAPEDFHTEFLDYILAVRVVENLEEAVAHIGENGSHHSDAIITRDQETARLFARTVDSAAVYINASTRFTDGGEFGLGAEIGISTQKLHARGPMGLDELVSYKYILTGSGQVR